MMTCDRVLDLLAAFADKSVGAEQAIEITEHLGSCGACAAAWKRHQAVDHFFRTEALPDLPASFWVKGRREILEQIAWTVQVREFPMRRLIYMAAAALLVGIGISVFGGSKEPEPTPIAAQPTPSPTPDIVEPTPDPTMAEPSKSPEPVVTPEIVQKTPDPTPTPAVSPESTPDPIVEHSPSPTPEASPEPTPDPIVERSPEPTPTLTPAPTVPPVLAMKLPGDADYLKLILEEQIAVIRAKDDAETLPALLFSSRKRILEMEIAATHRTEVLPELVDSYVAIVGEALDELLLRKMPMPLVKDAKNELASQLKALEKIKGAEGAMPACKAVAAGKSWQATFHSKAKIGVLAMVREMDQVALAPGLEKKMDKALAICTTRLVELDKAQAAGNAAAMTQAAEAYEAIMNRGIVDAILNAFNTGVNVSTVKARALAKLIVQVKKYERAAKAAKGDVQGPLQLTAEAAKAAKERLERINDLQTNGGSKSGPAPTALPGGSTGPAPTPSGSVDPGFDPNKR